MKYIRTKDGRIIDLTSKQVSSYELIDDKRAIDEYGEDSGFIIVYYYDQDIGEHIEYDGKGGLSMDNWYLKDIIKFANTIKELCDEFVFVANESKNPLWCFTHTETNVCLYTCEGLMSFPTKELLKKGELYGAIWTDKGLIYKAKMKGVLPNGEIDWELL